MQDTKTGFETRPVVQLTAYELEQRARAIRLKDNWRARLKTNQVIEPDIFVGPIAAGEKVVSSSRGNIAKFLRFNYDDALGVEMEGQGFLHGVHVNMTVQGCVVRGISDLLDGKAKADKAGSQERAAAFTHPLARGIKL